MDKVEDNNICGLTSEEFIITEEIKDYLTTNSTFLKINVDENNNASIIIYSTARLLLSQTIPILANFNFVVINEISNHILDNNNIYFISKLSIEVEDIDKLIENKNNISTLILKILNEELNFSSPIFVLSYLENLETKELFLLVALAKYKEQLLSSSAYHSTINIFIKYSHITKLIVDYFIEKFSPNITRDLKAKESAILEALSAVEVISDDKVLRVILKIIKNMQRTNYFLNTDIISFKIFTDKIECELDGIVPKIEAFVYSTHFNGVHLRMDKVSRGGLRWSNRYNDYRDEIKALMIAQEAKNAVIVPKGGKGGFIINKKNPTKEEFVKYYKLFITSLLELVDNIEDGEVVKKDNIVSYDGDDTYFVVAADKGTSTMSDTANEISIKNNFWLGDAFASGGSVGYDHKALGITAKGAIKSTERFFIEKGINIYKDSISIVGTGSMNGDVFGNGLIESDKFLLIGAISHREIFIDPNPDAEISYNERVRLFHQDNSNWSKYDKSKISKGGGVFKRSSKKIELTPEIKELLQTSKKYLNGEELAKALLGLKVDMIYLGGIGTYFKSTRENSVDIGDKENENIRLNANEIKASVVCEGANLGMTLEARVEFASLGGKVNLDSIDNGAGVNTSDHEVNMKIFLESLIANGSIKQEQRDESFKELTEFVVNDVLRTNYLQALSISLDEIRSQIDIEKFKKTVHVLDMNLSYFSRKNFHIPRDVDFNNIICDGKIVRPTLSLLTLYSKIVIENILKRSDMVESSEFDKYIFRYFPKHFHLTYKSSIKNHPLRKEIIAITISNEIINNYGATFVSDLVDIGIDNFLIKIKSYLLSDKLFNGRKFRAKLYNNDFEIGVDKLYSQLLKLEKNIDYTLKTIQLDNHLEFTTIYKYRDDMLDILKLLNITNEDTFEYIKFIAYIIKIQKQTGISFRDASQLAFGIVQKLDLVLLMQKIEEVNVLSSIESKLKSQTLSIIERIIVNISRDTIKFKLDSQNIPQAIESIFANEYKLDKFIEIKDKFMNSKKNSLMDSTIIVNELLLLT
ncbi:NAD-specific glutamate dehydrogenase, large form [hydrothermal vent metagenome]|uniref:NAD-specific glutamate dehydrogenase, large form n=1 Tax=hydrothermal vent metagenome TaxID=652676 RepID=A0A1W1ELA4_9ZZZZ